MSKVKDVYFATINTDASFDLDSKMGGYGIWISTAYGKHKQHGTFTNKLMDSNEAELLAVLNAIFIISHKIKSGDWIIKSIAVNTDCAFVVDFINKKKYHAKYQKLFELYSTYAKSFRNVIALKVKGHMTDGSPRQYVNDWCHRKSRLYLKTLNK